MGPESEHDNLIKLFLEVANAQQEKAAIIQGKKKTSYLELKGSVEKTAAWLHEKGIRKGDKVLVFIPMSVDLYRIILALFYIGAVAVFLDEWVRKKRLEQCCKISSCKAFIGIPKAHLLRLFSSELRKIPIKLFPSGYKKTKGEIPQVYAANPSDEALVTFTTGSTGNPKAAKRTHGFLNAQYLALKEEMNPQPSEVHICLLPIVFLMNLASGGTTVIANFNAAKPLSLDVGKLLKDMQKHQISTFVASPFIVKSLSQYILDNRINLPSVKKIYTGGAAVFPEDAFLFSKAFTNAEVKILYGSTEAEPISQIPAKELALEKDNVLEKGLKAGKVSRLIDLKIISIDDGPVAVKSIDEIAKMEGEVGEIIVSGKHVLKEYVNDPRAMEMNKIFTEEKFWHRTGDCGYLKDGELFLLGRAGQVISFNGKTFYPFIFEYFCTKIPDVVIGTLLLKENSLIAVIEKEKEAEVGLIEGMVKTVFLDVGEFVYLNQIPRDPRHFSKIDYKKLKIMVG